MNWKDVWSHCKGRNRYLFCVRGPPYWCWGAICLYSSGLRCRSWIFRKHILEGDRLFKLPDGKVALLPEEWFEKYSDLFSFGREQEGKLRVRKMLLFLAGKKRKTLSPRCGSPYSRIRCKPLLLSFRPPCFLIGKERYNGSVPCGYMNMQGTRGAVSRGRNLTAIR